jgi:hypothetical protein
MQLFLNNILLHKPIPLAAAMQFFYIFIHNGSKHRFGYIVVKITFAKN